MRNIFARGGFLFRLSKRVRNIDIGVVFVGSNKFQKTLCFYGVSIPCYVWAQLGKTQL